MRLDSRRARATAVRVSKLINISHRRWLAACARLPARMEGRDRVARVVQSRAFPLGLSPRRGPSSEA